MQDLKQRFLNEREAKWKYKELLEKQQRHNVWFVHNFIMGDETVFTQKVEEPKFENKQEKFKWYIKQININ